jgi:hypothetical protein
MNLQRLVSVGFAIALVGLPATAWSQPSEPMEPDTGYTLPWDQAKLTILPQQLATAATELRRDFAEQPVPEPGSKQSRAYHLVSDDLRLMESESAELAARIAKGASADESYPVYRRMRNLITDARADASTMTVPHSLQEKIEEARGILIQLDPYYGDVSTPWSR